MYVNDNPIYADEVRYDGKHEPEEVVCEIKWCVADVLDMMAHRGIELTDENLERLLCSRMGKTLRERSTEEGWEILGDIIADETYEWNKE